MKGLFYELLSLILMGAALYFFVRATGFLTGKDYLAAALTLVAGLALTKGSVELAKLAVMLRKED